MVKTPHHAKDAIILRTRGIAALLCALIYVITLGVYLPASATAPPPESSLQ